MTVKGWITVWGSVRSLTRVGRYASCALAYRADMLKHFVGDEPEAIPLRTIQYTNSREKAHGAFATLRWTILWNSATKKSWIRP